ncbi:prepilin-type N-terminal cleavage/methylation domain-containing protein [Bacillus sp. FJAT-26390]|uniref:type IV pilus modification PilV family protein n=1 Tax=Bacillus sp. FJAT-26390 TaxID=1743142 RepID=UPI000807E08E|nr:prepilin-type N-terminal cleavage/methylation domain-containing protein [Bacillus sp. FJAT-26390]OBZ12970.1 hypothetical protein A7975_08700 [Bacillus sp. FJAT-26390]
MRNQKGLTLVEVLGSLVLLAIAVLGITYILQQSTINTKMNEKIDQSVVISRNVMEEIKGNLKSTTPTISIYEQNLSLANIRNLSSATIYYPNAADKQYSLRIQSYPGSLETVQLDSVILNPNDYFRRVTIVCEELASAKKYNLEAYIEYKS